MAGTKKKPLDPIEISLTYKELNYIDSALSKEIARDESMLDMGGNIAHLLWFTKRLRGKLRRIRQREQRLRMGERKWKAQRKMINKFIRNARKASGEALRGRKTLQRFGKYWMPADT